MLLNTLFELLLILLHLINSVLVLLLKVLLELINFFTLLLTKLVVESGQHAVWEVRVEDVLLLIKLSLLELVDQPDFTILATLLHILSDLLFLGLILFLNTINLSIHLPVKLSLLTLKFLDLSIINSSRYERINSLLAITVALSGFLLLGKLCLHHCQDLFLELDCFCS